jgi:hypothetical protein
VPVTRRDFADICLRAVTLPGFAAWLDAQPPDYQPKFFTPEDFTALQSFTEILIPTDDTPGAREARCAQFIDFLLDASEQDPNAQAIWRKTMSTLRDLGYHAASSQERARLVDQMAQQDHPAFRVIKQLNAFAFYTSRAGQIETLDYRGNSYNATFPACTHPEHKIL